MDIDSPYDTATDIKKLFLAAFKHDLESLQSLLRTNSASLQDPETGRTPLHAAIAGARPTEKSHHSDGPDGNHADGGAREAGEGDADDVAGETVKLLLQNGAIWNDLDKNDETPGCLALRMGLRDLYNLMVDAGVRAEVLLGRLEGYEELKDEDSDKDGGSQLSTDGPPTISTQAADTAPADTNEDMATIFQTAVHPLSPTAGDPQPNRSTYLSSPLSFQPDRILDASSNGVMMSWETSLMSLTASVLAPTPGLRILNIGHGMGIVDSFFQTNSPKTHHIVEAHPDVLRRMREQGWYEKQGVVVHEGRWQDVLPKFLEVEARADEDPENLMFDAIYFDTFAEPYSALRTFFEDFVIGLLDDGGQWGFFNGMGADRQVCYDVYTKVVELDLFEAGWEVEWTEMKVPDLEEKGEWQGIKRPYWRVGEYRLPICRFMG
ncbi:MAG: hypothetical protein Q9218_006490 [Villophora microphyllina]